MAFYYICCYNIDMSDIKSKKLECIVTGEKAHCHQGLLC